MMNYKDVELEIVEFEVEDIITTSGTDAPLDPYKTIRLVMPNKKAKSSILELDLAFLFI